MKYMTKNAINQRFIDAVKTVIIDKKAKNKTKIAEILNLKPSTFSEILNKRTGVSVETVALFCSHFKVCPKWLIMNKGNMYSSLDDKQEVLEVVNNNDELLLQKEISAIKLNQEYLTENLNSLRSDFMKLFKQTLEDRKRLIDKDDISLQS